MERSYFWANDSDSAASETNDRETSWKNTPAMNSLSFCFLATAILILMFLVMAIFERLMRSTHPHGPHQTAAAPRHSEMQHEEQYFSAKEMDGSPHVSSLLHFNEVKRLTLFFYRNPKQKRMTPICRWQGPMPLTCLW